MQNEAQTITRIQDRCVALRSCVKGIIQGQNQTRALATRNIMASEELHWDKLTTKENASLKKRATELVKTLEKGEPVPVSAYLRETVLIAKLARKPLEDFRKELEKQIIALVKSLPFLIDWIEHPDQKGVGPLMIGQIIGETGDLRNYSTFPKVWKRMGLAVLHGSRQGNPGPDATKEDWIEHGYCKRRRSVGWNLATCVIKAGGPGYDFYIDAKARAAEAHPEWGPKPGHWHNHAQRVLTKRILRDMWRVFR